MAINGNNILIYYNGTAISGTKSNEIQTDTELIEISSPSSGEWKSYITGRKNWSINVSFLVLAYDGVRNLLNVGNTFSIKFKGRDSSDSDGVSGSAILKNCKITAIKGNLVQGSFQFVGTGILS